MEDIQKTLTPALLAVLSGITIIAYRHPKSYAKICDHIFRLYMAIIACISFWNVGCTASLKALTPYISADTLVEAGTKIEGVKFSTLFYVITVAVFGYLFSLQFLPFLLKEDEGIKSKKDKE